MRTVCSRWILGVAYTALCTTMVGCGDDEPLEIDCPAGYITIRVEADSDEFVCTKAPQAECDEGLVAVPTDDGKFMCMDAHECGDDDVAVQQPDGRFQCIPIVEVNCSSGKVVMEASNGTIACVDPPSVDCEDGMVPMQSDAGIVTCVPQQNVECEPGMVAMEGSNGLIACVSQTNLECEDDMVPMAGENGFACVPPTSINCGDTQVPLLTSNGGVACVSRVNLDCDDGMVPTQTENGIFACIEQLEVECTDGKVAVLQGDKFACTDPVDIECPEGKVPVLDVALDGSYACRDPLTVECEADQVVKDMGDGTFACIGMQEISCAEGFILTQEGDGTYNCVEVPTEDVAPGTISCPPGTMLADEFNDTKTPVCKQIDEVQCPDGFQLAGGVGNWECVNYRSGQDIEIVVEGVVRDDNTSYPLEGATITIMGLEDVDGNTITVTTDASGYFRTNGYASGGSITAIVNATGYVPVADNREFDNYDGTTITKPEDSYFEFTVTAVPASDLVVAGTVFAAGAIVPGVQVQLRSQNPDDAGGEGSLNPTQTQVVTTDANGLFIFEAVPNGQYEVIVAQYDADGDGQPDYRVYTWDCDGAASLQACNQDISNLQLTLNPYFQGNLVYTNLLTIDGEPVLDPQADPPVEDIPFADMVEGAAWSNDAITWLMPGGGTNMVFQLTDPIDVTNAVIEFWAIDHGNDVAQIGATVAASADGKVLTITPSAALTADSDPNTVYDIRIRNLAWMTGEYVQEPIGGAPGHIFVDVKAPMDYAPNPTNLALYYGSNADATALAIDSGNAWFRNAAGVVIDGQGFDAVEMSFTVAAGIDEYVVYARWPDSGGSYVGQEWEEFDTIDIADSGNRTGNMGWGTIGLDDIVTAAEWDDLGLGHEAQITLCSKTEVGDITPVDPTNIITISDDILLGLSPTEDVGGDYVETNYLASPTLTMEYGLTFSEEISQAFTPSLSPIAGSVTLREAPPIDWGDVEPWDDAGTAEVTVVDNRYTRCNQVEAEVREGQAEFTLIDDSDWDIFATGDTLLAFPDIAANGPPWNAGQTMTVTNVFNKLVSLQNPTVGRVSANDDEVTIAAGAWVCAGPFPTTGAPTGDYGSDYIIDGQLPPEEMMGLPVSPAPTQFFVGQTVCFIGNADTDVTDCREIEGITATQLLFPCMDSEPNDDTEDGCEGPPTGSRVVALPAATGIAARGAEQLTIIQGATLGTNPLRVGIGDLATLKVAGGDALLIDVDGDWATVGDRVRATVTQALSTYNGTAETRNEITVTSTSTASLTEDSLLILLGNKAVQVPNINTAVDSSGNNGTAAGANYDEIAICDKAIADVDGDDICAAGESFVF